MTGAEGSGALNDPLLGKVIQGRYRICRTIGSGGMGVVYEAEHLLIGRKVAVKRLAARAALSNACVARFRREARAAASVGNSHVVDVLDMGELEDGSLYIVLEHLDGVHLGWALAEARHFPVSRAIFVLCQLCDALSAVHDAGIVHRDLKPENIFLIERDGALDFVKLLGFGVCKLEEATGSELTATGDVIGTPLFMAPEQVENQQGIDHRTDVYALGAILYLLLTGQAPFDAPTLPKLFIRICTESPPSLQAVNDSLPAGLDSIVQRALDKSPERRFQSCMELKQALLHFSEALAPASGTRFRDELAATLPATTAAIYLGDVKPDTDTVGPESIPLTGFLLPRSTLARFGALGLLAAVLLAVFWARRAQPSGAATALTSTRPDPAGLAAPARAPVTEGVSSEPTEAAPRQERAPAVRPQRTPPPSPPQGAPSAMTVGFAAGEPPPESSPSVEPRNEPLSAPASEVREPPPSPMPSRAAAGMRLNQEPKRDL